MSQWGRVDLLRRDLLNTEGDGQPRAWLRKDDVAALLAERDEFARRLGLREDSGRNAPEIASAHAASAHASTHSGIGRIRDVVEECAEDFHVCPACGFKDPEATRESNLFLLLTTALHHGGGGEEGLRLAEPWRCAALTRLEGEEARACSWPACGCDPMARSAVESLRRMNQDPAPV